MPINTWWEADPKECYWIEITDRDDLGENLIAPQLDKSGHETPSYSLVRYVRPGDVVLHWSKAATADPAIVGISTVAGNAFTSELEWQPHGTYGRMDVPSGLRPAWEAPLMRFQQLKQPVTLARLRSVEVEVRKVHDQLAKQHPAPLYFPYALSNRRPLRTAQGYFLKFPAALLDVIPELSAARRPSLRPDGEDAQSSVSPEVAAVQDLIDVRPSSGQAFRSSPEERIAIETLAMKGAQQHYEALGWVVDPSVAKTESYDLRCTRAQSELHVEVKGTTTSGAQVLLTPLEVTHARTQYPNVALFVLAGIQVKRTPDGAVEASGGEARVIDPWRLETDNLSPIGFSYSV